MGEGSLSLEWPEIWRPDPAQVWPVWALQGFRIFVENLRKARTIKLNKRLYNKNYLIFSYHDNNDHFICFIFEIWPMTRFPFVSRSTFPSQFQFWSQWIDWLSNQILTQGRFWSLWTWRYILYKLSYSLQLHCMNPNRIWWNWSGYTYSNYNNNFLHFICILISE